MTFFWRGPTGFLKDKAFEVSSWAAEMALKENDKSGRHHHTNTKTQRQERVRQLLEISNSLFISTAEENCKGL